MLSGIRTRDPSNQAAADLRLKTARLQGSAMFVSPADNLQTGPKYDTINNKIGKANSL
jgi:hypothetical protein